jgi:hypothetical protein
MTRSSQNITTLHLNTRICRGSTLLLGGHIAKSKYVPFIFIEEHYL